MNRLSIISDDLIVAPRVVLGAGFTYNAAEDGGQSLKL